MKEVSFYVGSWQIHISCFADSSQNWDNIIKNGQVILHFQLLQLHLVSITSYSKLLFVCHQCSKCQWEFQIEELHFELQYLWARNDNRCDDERIWTKHRWITAFDVDLLWNVSAMLICPFLTQICINTTIPSTAWFQKWQRICLSPNKSTPDQPKPVDNENFNLPHQILLNKKQLNSKQATVRQ